MKVTKLIKSSVVVICILFFATTVGLGTCSYPLTTSFDNQDLKFLLNKDDFTINDLVQYAHETTQKQVGFRGKVKDELFTAEFLCKHRICTPNQASINIYIEPYISCSIFQTPDLYSSSLFIFDLKKGRVSAIGGQLTGVARNRQAWDDIPIKWEHVIQTTLNTIAADYASHDAPFILGISHLPNRWSVWSNADLTEQKAANPRIYIDDISGNVSAFVDKSL